MKDKNSRAAYLYLAPGLFFLTIFIVIPIIFLFLLSFFKWDMFSGDSSFAGFTNYLDMLNNPAFYNALKNTFIYVAGILIPSIIIPLLLAIAVNQRIRGAVIYRTSIFLPVVVSLAASGIIWLWILDHKRGILNHLLVTFGFDKVDWLGNPSLALPSVILVTLWKRIGYNMVIFFAGLQVIPSELYEAARMDGAKFFSQFRYITWPNLLPATSFVIVINLIFSFRDFSQVYVMTRGGPMGRTTTLVYHIYESAFSEFNIGYAAAVSMVLFLLVLAITYLKICYFEEDS